MAVPLSGRPETRHLVIFVKAPRLGRVKRRLARDVGAVEAWTFYRRTLEDAVRRLSRDARWRTLLAVAPDGAAHAGYRWPAIPRFGQVRGDLGARMYRALKRPPPGPVVLIGGDIPDVGPPHVAEAFRLLGAHDLVFGPAEDGGFWLVGARRAPRFTCPFRDVRWSHAETLADVRAALDPGTRVAEAATLMDVDDGEALRRWRALSRRAASRAPEGAA